MTLSPRTESPESPDSGMTLVELIVVIMISSLLLGVVAVLFGNGLSSQQQTAQRDAATGTANGVAAHLQESMRDSTGAVLYQGAAPGSGSFDGQELRLAVRTPAGTLECRTWQWLNEGAGGKLAFRTGSGTWRTLASWNTTGTEWGFLVNGRNAFNPGVGDAVPGRQLSFVIGVSEGDATVSVSGGDRAQVVLAAPPTSSPCS